MAGRLTKRLDNRHLVAFALDKKCRFFFGETQVTTDSSPLSRKCWGLIDACGSRCEDVRLSLPLG